MKKYLQLAVLAVAVIMTACEKPAIDGEDADIGGNVHLSFVPTTADTRVTAAIGDYFSKINLQAFNEDGEKVFDKVKTQTSDDPNFGTITLTLAEGSYTVVAVGHSCAKSATIKSPQVVQFTASDGEKLTDTFNWCGQIEVGEGETNYHDLRMNRVTAMVRFQFDDAPDDIPANFARMKFDYTGGSANYNPTTMQGCTKSTQSESRQPSSEYRVFTFPYLAKDGKLQMTVTAIDDQQAMLASHIFFDVPVSRNRISTYRGSFFGSGGGEWEQTTFGISINGEWEGDTIINF